MRPSRASCAGAEDALGTNKTPVKASAMAAARTLPASAAAAHAAIPQPRESDAFGAGASTHLYGTIVAAADDASVQACSPGTHLAAWRIDLSLLGQQLQVPIAISRAGPGDPPEAGLKLELCPPSLPAPEGGQAGI